MNAPHQEQRCTRGVVRRLLEATDRTLAEMEELKKARAALSLAASRDALRIVPADGEEATDGE
jgi:hypothetical protein